MSIRFSAAMSAALVIAALSADATLAREPGMPRGERTFDRLDANKDGALAIEELEAKSVRRFMRLDADKDDKVTRAELENWLNRLTRRRIDRILTRMDTNKDAAVTSAELRGYIAGLFDLADSDKSGGVTLKESRAYHVTARKKRTEARKARSQTRQ